MKTILITGGASGLGKGIALHYLRQGDRVIAVGSSGANGETFLSAVVQLGAGERAVYLQADLSLIEENRRVLREIEARFPAIDILVFCAAKHSQAYTETSEGIEFTFALAYLSRFILSYGLKECLERADNPIILNICGSGMKGEVNWADLQFRNSFEAQKVMMHGSRLNDLLGVAFAQNDAAQKIKYVLYNPWVVVTPGMISAYNGLLMKLIYKVIGKSVEQAVVPIAGLLDRPSASTLSAYRERKQLDLSLPTYDQENARKLYSATESLLGSFG